MNTKISVAFVKPPLVGHLNRGVGIFGKNLMAALSKREKVRISEVDIRDDKSPYDIIHYPYFDPFFLTLPYQNSKPTVVTVHDLIPLRLKTHYPVGIRGRVKWEMQKRALRKADCVFTDSFSSKKDIAMYTGISDGKISVVYGGVDESYYEPLSSRTIQETKNKFGLKDRFILYVGDINYNKNIPGLIKAFGEVINKEKVNLVLVGPAFKTDTKELGEIKKEIRDLSVGKNMQLIDYVTHIELRSLYKLASLYVQPSFAEGFGLPVLEAMASRCVVVSSFATSLGEVCGDGAIPINPNDVGDMAEGMVKGLTDNNLRNKMMEKGFVQSKKFTWDTAAEKTEEAYVRLYKEHEKKE